MARQQREIDLLLSDIRMPEMNGVEAYPKIQELIRALFMSGYSDGSLLGQDMDRGVALLQKPFLPEQLLERVRQALDQRNAA